MEDLISKKSRLKLPEVIAGKLTSSELYITPEGTDKIISATWGYLPLLDRTTEKEVTIKRNRIFNVDYLNLKNLPLAGHERAGYCKIWVREDSRVKMARGYYFHDFNNDYSVGLITDNSHLIFI